MPRGVLCLLVVVGVATGLPAPALASRTGGMAAPGDPTVTALRCVATAAVACAGADRLVRGGQVRVTGRALDASQTLIFRGSRGRGDDVTAAADHVRSGHFDAQVPPRARSGPVEVLSAVGVTARAPAPVRVAAAQAEDLAARAATYFVGGRRQPTLTISLPTAAAVAIEAVRASDEAVVARWEVAAPAGSSRVGWDATTPQGPAAPGAYRLRLANEGGVRAAAVGDPGVFALSDHIFPIRGRHDLGQSQTNNFGGDRGHEGQDLFAACGTRLAAARGGTVKFAASDERAGNYVVITGAGSGLDYVYMHMRSPAALLKGQQVFTGQKIGEVGDSGNADGCHLHFELWQAPGWYSGGSAIDPLALLSAWDAVS